MCRTCYSRWYYNQNPEKWQKWQRDKYAEDPERERTYARTWYQKNEKRQPRTPRVVGTEKLCSSCKTWKPVTEFWKDKDRSAGYRSRCKVCMSRDHRSWHSRNWNDSRRSKSVERARTWRVENPERDKESHRNWRKNNRPKIAAAKARWNERARSAGPAFTWQEFEALIVLYEGRCAYCGSTPRIIEHDHRTPLSRGGANNIGNILPCCRRCNSEKGSQTEAEYRARLKSRR